MYDTILISTDGSDTAQLATERAIDVADRYDATLHVLYVIEHSREDPTVKGYEEKISEEINHADTVLEQAAEQANERRLTVETAREQAVPRRKSKSTPTKTMLD